MILQEYYKNTEIKQKFHTSYFRENAQMLSYNERNKFEQRRQKGRRVFLNPFVPFP